MKATAPKTQPHNQNTRQAKTMYGVYELDPGDLALKNSRRMAAAVESGIR